LSLIVNQLTTLSGGVMSKLKEFAEFLLEVDKCGVYQRIEDEGYIWKTYYGGNGTHLTFNEFDSGDLRLKPKEEEKKKIPLELCDITPNMVLRYPSFEKGMFTAVLYSHESYLTYYWPHTMDVVNGRYCDLLINKVEYSTDNGKTWKGCYKYEN
jgi:hypothetical protein